MSAGLTSLKRFVQQRLTAAAQDIVGHVERTISEYEEEMDRKLQLLQLYRSVCPADVQRLVESKEHVPPELHEWGPSLEQEGPPEASYIKEEQDEPWNCQEVEQLQKLGEAESVKYPFAPSPVKSEEDDEEKPRFSQLQQRQTGQMETHGGDCAGPESTSNCDTYSQPEIEDQHEDTSELTGPKCNSENRQHELGSNLLKIHEASRRDLRCNTGEKLLSCSECGKSFGLNRDLKIHMKIHTGEKTFCCSVCGKTFRQQGHLTGHMAVHTGEKLHSCSVCGQTFTLDYQLSRHKCVEHRSSQLHQSQTEHMESRTVGEESKGPEPAGSSSLATHSDDRTNKYPTGHVTNKTGDSPLLCSECGKKFGSTKTLKMHMKIIHAGEKPYTCQFCGKTFGRAGQLKIHVRNHTGEKPYGCSLCSKRFVQKGHLSQHMVVHTGEKPYSCSACGQKFSWDHQLRRHKAVCAASSQLHQN